MNTLMAEIPLLDWTGPAFLAFYVVAYIITLIWSRRRLQTVLRPFENRSASIDLEPYEVAFLSGGPNRVTQMAVAQLILIGAAVWKKQLLGPRLIAAAAGEPAGLKSVEKQLWQLLVKAGSKGLAVNTLTFQLKPNHAALETRLAIRGLRPSGSERSSAAFRAVMPLLGLLALGGVKLLIGISRDRPVLFLFLLMILTVITAMAMAGFLPRITEKGEVQLGKLRSCVPAQVKPGTGAISDVAFMSFALFGPAAFIGVPSFEELPQEMQKHMAQPAAGGGDSGGGCSSGCSSGSSGCGGGGCGGCGGS
jgi:uncharacterized protein (TIGR04222 family)